MRDRDLRLALSVVVAGALIYYFGALFKADPSIPKSRYLPLEGLLVSDLPQKLGARDVATTRADDMHLSIEDKKRLNILRDILQSKNDNDKRMDQDLRVLSPELKKALVKEYVDLPGERLNERGTLVFLLGRNLNEISDLDFFESVLSQGSCSSMESCKENPFPLPENTEAGSHAQLADEVSLAYPQLQALIALEKSLKSGAAKNNSLFSRRALELLKTAAKSDVQVVAKKAEAIQKSIRN